MFVNLQLLRWRSLLLALWLAGAAGAAAAKTVLVLGDSLSAGYGIESAQSWPALLQRRLHSRDPDLSVVNISISGETTAGGLSRLPTALQRHRPQWVIIALGANDGLRGLSLATMRANLSAMIADDRRAGARTLLVGMMLPPNYGSEYGRAFAGAFADVARREKVAFVPFLLAGFADRREAFQPDGLHPTAAYQPAMLDNIWPALDGLLRQR